LKEWAEPKIKEDEEKLQRDIAESKERGDPWWKQPINMKYKKKWYMYDIDDPDPHCSTEEFGEWIELIVKRGQDTAELRSELLLEDPKQAELKKAADKIFVSKQDARAQVMSKEIQNMLESIGYGVTTTELHYLLKIFDATDGFNMLPDVPFEQSKFLWCVGECQQMKMRFEHVKPEDWVMQYEEMIMNQEMQKQAGLEGTEDWPHMKAVNHLKPGYKGPVPEYTGPRNFTAEQRAALKAENEREKAEREAMKPEWYKNKLKKQEEKEKSKLKVKEKK